MTEDSGLHRGRAAAEILDKTRRAIADQQKTVAALLPGSEGHRLATNVLLLLLDTLHVFGETFTAIEALNARAGKRR